MSYRIGMEYEGEWEVNLFHGQGQLKQGSTTYVGQFTAGKKQGQGKISWQGFKQSYEVSAHKKLFFFALERIIQLNKICGVDFKYLIFF